MDLRNFGLSDEELRQLGYDVSRRASKRASAGTSHPAAPSPSLPASVARPQRAPGARGWLVVLGVLVAAGWGASSARRLPRPVPASSPDAAFSSGRAMAQLADVARHARPTGSPENERVRNHLVGRLRSLGLEPELQAATWFEREPASVRAATLRNVVARVPGTEPTGALLLTAHYDGAPLSPAAGDNGIGVATVLEAVRAIVSGTPLRNDVIVLFTDGDELGLLGSRAFAARHPWMADVAVALSVDARGVSGPAVWFEAGPENGRIVDLLATIEARPAAFSVGRSVRAHALEAGPENPLMREGVRSLSFTVLGDAAWQHQPGDVRARVSERSVQHAGRQLLAMTRALGRIDLRDELSAPDRVYVSLPWIGLVHYTRGWVIVTSLSLVVLWALGLVVRGPGITRRGVGVSVLASAGAVAATAAAAQTLLRLASSAHPELGTLTTAFFEDGRYTLAVAALALACGASTYAVARHWARADELVLGGLLVPLLACVWLTFWAPFTAPALQLPMAAALAGAALVVALGPVRARTPSPSLRASLTVISAVTLLLVVPTVELLSSTWTFRAATAIGAVMGLAVLLFWPLMESLLFPRAWWTPVAALGAAAAIVGLASPGVRGGGADHPLPTTLLYLADQPVLGSPVATHSGGPPAHASRLRSMAGRWLTVPGPGEEWARSWAGGAAPASTAAGPLLLGPDSLYRVVGTAPVSELATPRATLVHSALREGRREVEVALEPGLSGEMTGIMVPEGSSGTLVGLGEARWAPGGPAVRSAVHWGVPVTPWLRVRLELAAKERAVDLVVVEHHLRPREILGGYFFQRPDSLTANVAMGSDRVIQRTLLSIPLVDLPTEQ